MIVFPVLLTESAYCSGCLGDLIAVNRSCATSLLTISLCNSSLTKFVFEIRTLFVPVGTTGWSLVEATFQHFLLVVGGIAGRLKRKNLLPSFTSLDGLQPEC